jgi:hypothetical protein
MRIYPVIHVNDITNVVQEVAKARRHEVDGVFLIDHDADDERLLGAIDRVASYHGDVFVGANFIRRSLDAALRVLCATFGPSDLPLQAIWTDSVDFETLPRYRRADGWDGLYFGGVAFKYQEFVPTDELEAAGVAVRDFVDVAVTSGTGTGKAADPERIRALRRGLLSCPVAVASGVTPENVGDYLGLADHVLVASGIAGDHGGIDESKLARLMGRARAEEGEA